MKPIRPLLFLSFLIIAFFYLKDSNSLGGEDSNSNSDGDEKNFECFSELNDTVTEEFLIAKVSEQFPAAHPNKLEIEKQYCKGNKCAKFYFAKGDGFQVDLVVLEESSESGVGAWIKDTLASSIAGKHDFELCFPKNLDNKSANYVKIRLFQSLGLGSYAVEEILKVRRVDGKIILNLEGELAGDFMERPSTENKGESQDAKKPLSIH